MSARLLGYVDIGDEEQLSYIESKHNITLDHQAVWNNAALEMFESGSRQVEVRVDGLDYIFVSEEED